MVTFNELGNLGRLGNQLWQIAAVIGYARKYNMDYTLQPWKYFNYFEGSLPQLNQESSAPTYQEPRFAYTEIPYREHVNLTGYYQSEQYFKHCKDEILQTFAFKKGILGYIKKFIVLNKSVTTKACSVQVRRTDYVTTMGHYYHNLSPDWYFEAMKKMGDDYHFFITTDDVEYCRSVFGHMENVTIGALTEIEDLCLGALCHSNIIANSSFGWWQQYLNPHPDKRVIAPSKDKWFQPVANHNVDDLYLPNWELL